MKAKRPTTLRPVVLALAMICLAVPIGIRSGAVYVLPLLGVAFAGGALWLDRSAVRPAGRSRRPRPVGLPRRYALLPVAWVVLMFVENQKFTQAGISGGSVTRGASLTVENFIEMAVFALVGLALLLSRPPPFAREPSGRLAVLFSFPCLVLLSTTWSLVPFVTLFRGVELVVLFALASFSARLVVQYGSDGSILLRPVVRLHSEVCTVLALLAFAFPFDRTGATSSDSSIAVADVGSRPAMRLSWYGVAPLTAAVILTTAALALLVAGPRFLRLSWPGWALRLAVISAAAVRAQGRSALVGFAVAALVALWMWNRQRPAGKWLGAAFYVFVASVVGVFFSSQIISAAARGEGLPRLYSLDGRVGLWSYALGTIDTVKKTFVGSGMGSSGRILIEQVAFAGQAHSTPIEVLLSAGVIGLLLLTAQIVCVARFVRSPMLAQPVRAVCGSLLALFLVLAIGEPGLAGPGHTYTWFAFLAVFALVPPVRRLDQRTLPHTPLHTPFSC